MSGPTVQGGDLILGETFVQGKDRDTARRLLAACDTLGIDQQHVRTVTQGFVVPNEVWDTAEATRRADAGLDL